MDELLEYIDELEKIIYVYNTPKPDLKTVVDELIYKAKVIRSTEY